MAGSDDETVELGVTENEERRLCGMAGSPLMIHYLVKIALHLKNYANDIHIRSVVQPMIDKYNKY